MILIKKIKKLFLLVIKLIIGYPLYFLSGFTPRNPQIWLFGSFGIFNDNSRYLYVYLLSKPEYKIRPIWISSNKKSVAEAKKFGEAYISYSPKGLYYSLIGGVYIFSSYINNINFFTSRNSFTVNLWHGIPLKKIEFDITTKPLVNIFKNASLISKIIYPHVHIKYNLILSPSQYVANYSFKSAFRVTDKDIIIAQYPRVSYLEDCQPLTKFSNFEKVFLYAPTWRDSQKNFLEESKIDLTLINKIMKDHNSVFIIKLHSATSIKVDLSELKNIKLISNKEDPIRILKTADYLITDYSSIYLDYIILNRPILHFCFDIEDYMKNRELYFPYDSAIAGNRLNSGNDLIKFLEESFNDYQYDDIARKIAREKFISNDIRGNHHIVKSIIKAYSIKLNN